MKIEAQLSEDAVLTELGLRLARRRIEMQFTQAVLARQAGVSKRTIERIEAGATAQMSTMIRILRSLHLLDRLDQLVPTAGPRPMDLLAQQKTTRQRVRQRVRSVRGSASQTVWNWGDET